MSKIEAKIVADSKNEFGNRITTMVVTFPRIILAELNTHRMFSRNSASSRAIPFEKMCKAVSENPFIPIAFQKEHKGMQGSNYITDDREYAMAYNTWINAIEKAISSAKNLSQCGVTKQLANRILEPFMYHTVIVTFTEIENFFALRCPSYILEEYNDNEELIDIKIFRSRKDILNNESNWFIRKDDNKRFGKFPKDLTDLEWLLLNKGQAEIHMMALAEAIYDEYSSSTPKQLKAGEWHIPFQTQIDYEELGRSTINYYKNNPTEQINVDKWAIAISTVYCARVSYTVVGEDQKPLSYERMIEIHDNLLAAEPKHMSPFEHCARAMDKTEYEENFAHDFKFLHDGSDLSKPEKNWDMIRTNGISGNFLGFLQYRKMIPNENITNK